MIQDTIEYISKNQERYIAAIARHFEIAIIVLLISLAIAIPLGYICAKNDKLAIPILNLTNLLRTIPAIAKFLILMPFFGIGMKPALIALVIMEVPTILINTMSGVQEIDPQVVESANGMGLGKFRTCYSVELPLAMPFIMNGVRMATIQVITGTTIAAYIGAGGLGDFIYIGLEQNRSEITLAGAVMVAFISILLDIVLSSIQKRIRNRIQ